MQQNSFLARVAVLIILGVSTFFFAGCSVAKNTEKSSSTVEAEQKNQTITITGKLSASGGRFFITDAAGTIHDVETYSVSLDSYVGSTVTASGQYSGDTLFVTEITN